MTEKPQWVTDDSVQVNIQSLHDFAQTLQHELETNIKPNVEPILARLSGQSPTTRAAEWQYNTQTYQGATFGIDSRHTAAQHLGAKHQRYEEEAHILLQRLVLGIEAIATAAKKIAEEYSSVDELNNADMAISSYFKDDDNQSTERDSTNL